MSSPCSYECSVGLSRLNRLSGWLLQLFDLSRVDLYFWGLVDLGLEKKLTTRNNGEHSIKSFRKGGRNSNRLCHTRNNSIDCPSAYSFQQLPRLARNVRIFNGRKVGNSEFEFSIGLLVILVEYCQNNGEIPISISVGIFEIFILRISAVIFGRIWTQTLWNNPNSYTLLTTILK